MICKQCGGYIALEVDHFGERFYCLNCGRPYKLVPLHSEKRRLEIIDRSRANGQAMQLAGAKR